MSRIRAGFALLAAAAVMAATAACTSGHAKPTPSPTPPSPTAPSTTPPATKTTAPPATRTGPLTTGPNVKPGEKPPALTAFAHEHTSAGAVSFAVYYEKAVDWAIATADPYPIQRISAPSCETCSNLTKRLTQLSAEGAYVRGGRLTVESAKLTTPQERDVKSDYVVEVVYRVEPDAIVRPNAAPSTEATVASTETSYVFVSWVNGGWQIVEEESVS